MLRSESSAGHVDPVATSASAQSDGGTMRGAVPGGRAHAAHLVLARILFIAILVQVFFAGLGVFNVTGFLPHAILGTAVVLAGFALPILAWRGHLGRSLLRESWALALLLLLQGLLIDAGRLVPLILAFHPVNAMMVTLVAFHLAFQRIVSAEA